VEDPETYPVVEEREPFVVRSSSILVRREVVHGPYDDDAATLGVRDEAAKRTHTAAP
jgi:hypothetical protein